MSDLTKTSRIKVWHFFVVAGIGAAAVLLWPVKISATFTALAVSVAVGLYLAWRNK